MMVMMRWTMTLETWIDTLQVLPPDLRVIFDRFADDDHRYAVPTELTVWSGDYRDLTLDHRMETVDFSGDLSHLATVAELLQDAKGALGRRVYGYDDIVMNEDTRVWAHDGRSADEIELVGISIRRGVAVIGTSDPV